MHSHELEAYDRAVSLTIASEHIVKNVVGTHHLEEDGTKRMTAIFWAKKANIRSFIMGDTASFWNFNGSMLSFRTLNMGMEL